jgi:hypothetical protein
VPGNTIRFDIYQHCFAVDSSVAVSNAGTRHERICERIGEALLMIAGVLFYDCRRIVL